MRAWQQRNTQRTDGTSKVLTKVSSVDKTKSYDMYVHCRAVRSWKLAGMKTRYIHTIKTQHQQGFEQSTSGDTETRLLLKESQKFHKKTKTHKTHTHTHTHIAAVVEKLQHLRNVGVNTNSGITPETHDQQRT